MNHCVCHLNSNKFLVTKLEFTVHNWKRQDSTAVKHPRPDHDSIVMHWKYDHDSIEVKHHHRKPAFDSIPNDSAMSHRPGGFNPNGHNDHHGHD